MLYLVKLTDISKATRADGSKKKRMLITFGEHAREFLPVESFFKLVHDTCKAFKAGEGETVHWMGNIELLLIGLVNPDGRRHLEKTKDWCWRGMANMVDVNRNCDWEWGGVGSRCELVCLPRHVRVCMISASAVCEMQLYSHTA